MSKFRSPRQAIGYMYSCMKQGRYRRPKWHERLDATYMDESLHHVIGCFVYGPRDKGFCGVTPGSTLDQQLYRWSGLEPACNYRNKEVRRVERRVLQLLHEHEMKLTARMQTERNVFQDYDGEHHDHLREAAE